MRHLFKTYPRTFDIQTGTFEFNGTYIPIFITIYETEVRELNALGLTRSEAIQYLTQ